MNHFSEQNAIELEQHRSWLRMLAAVGIDRRLQGKIDLSGIVQQSLAEASLVAAESRPVESGARKAWLRTILAGNLTDEMRRLRAARRDVGREQSLDQSLHRSSVRIRNWLAADQSTPSARLLSEERTEQMLTAMTSLSADAQSALVMRYFQDCSLNDIAEELKRTPAAVAGLLKRGLQQLREHLQSRSDSDGNG